MKITDVEVLALEAPGDYGTKSNADESHGPKRTCVILVTTDEGITGCAQVESQPHVVAAIVNAPGEASGLFSGLRSLAIGQDPMQVECLRDRLFLGSFYFGRRGAALQAISGIDIACWDIIGKATHLPIATMLGGQRRSGARAYASTLFRTTPQGVREAAEGYRVKGFTAVKFGWGPFGDNLLQDVALVEAARDGLGADVELMVDAGWRRRRTPKEAIALARAIEAYSPTWIEEPCFPEDYDTYRRVCDAVSIPIAAGEAEATTWSFRLLAEHGGVDILQPDISRCGGLTIARRIAYLADDLNVIVTPHAWGSDILTVATLHFVCFLARETVLEFNTSDDPLSRGLIANPLAMRDGMVQLPQGPGLGIELDMEAIRSLSIPI